MTKSNKQINSAGWSHRKRQTMLSIAAEEINNYCLRNDCASCQTVTSAVPEKGKGSLLTP
jgi:hypothetical protein